MSHFLISSYVINTTVIKTIRCRHKNKQEDQGNIRESPEINPCMYSQLTLESGLRTEAGERIGSSITGVRKTGYSYEIGSLSHHMQKSAET